jgi:hypothetical protein
MTGNRIRAKTAIIPAFVTTNAKPTNPNRIEIKTKGDFTRSDPVKSLNGLSWFWFIN